ncbi:hypothetical protein L2719_05255 [Shewanella schlegeliana]|uniref:DUF5683 domain-containing protein n=1 Tax=Shewanella schlegeliana TaxID=190308 RepID=A0ABS1SYJ5_9GAMM|nr:DUF6677 family protein [Shewanella schlegeliana]MBL4912949.1 hypothetical protein [Shewanella schlegeliana]MCL1108955.1 hypothetical protein [Shewanella schlegeliana]GIU23562.1 hypothetical protein TUM4433_06210 [Shewanella schlegeliana]
MKTSVKAALLSAFVCPGSGHFYLKKHAMGKVLLVTTIASLCFLLWHAYQRAQLISQQILKGEIPLELNAIYSAVTQAPVGNEALYINIATIGFIAAWVIGVIDSYRLGKLADDAELKH